ncbi:MAG: excinuclease ABC subunit UvrA [Alphaproteobacteria bacterium]|nr:excinuclease ABC subunit UvrA [Alphaproteobacteria bacterium]
MAKVSKKSSFTGNDGDCAIKYISIRGARENNLKNFDIDIPKNKLVVITGVSGSGKSSLAFDTIYAEGQRRYVESLSAYARQFLDMQKKPELDSIEGLAPAISIEQKTTSHNPRSTVGTVTEIYDYMRLLWARVGVPHSPVTGRPISSQTVQQMADQTMTLPVGTKIYIMAPLVQGRKGEYKKELAFLAKQGFRRAIIDGKLVEDITSAPALDKNKTHNISVIVDRMAVSADMRERLTASLEASFRLVPNIVIVRRLDTNEDILFSSIFACPESGFSLPEIEPKMFSFNSPAGACNDCGGLGVLYKMSADLVVPDLALSIREGAIAPWSRGGMLTQYEDVIEALAKKYGIPMSKPWKSLSKEHQNIILHGTGNEEITIKWGGGHHSWSKPFEGVIPNLDRRYRASDSPAMIAEYEKYQAKIACNMCGGKRLNLKSLCVKIAGADISEATDMSIAKALDWFRALPAKLPKSSVTIATPILADITDRLTFLMNVGLQYLTLNRTAGTLSGGESQRIRLASQIGSGLSGVLYVLDEPSIGLHQRDNERLLSTLHSLRDKDNSLIVVEHDEDTMRAADWLIDVGPGAGTHGGHIVSQGLPSKVISDPKSLTGQYLSGIKKIPVPKTYRKGNGEFIKIIGASENNLKNITAEIPLGKFVAVTGVSGSGKSTLISDTLYPAVMRHIYGSKTLPGKHKAITGLEHIDKVVDIDQSPIGRTPRSNPATYTGLWNPIRDFFAALPAAKARGYAAGRFSFNVKGGRCEACEGDGVKKIEMHFLPDVYVECDVCKGRRFNRDTLEIKYNDKNIADVLDLSVFEAYRFFQGIPAIRKRLERLREVGLDYLRLGHSSLELSGGEAQRVKLAKELSHVSTGRTLYILDEPTTGLHFADIEMLLTSLHKLVDAGNTIVVIEHNFEVIKTADYIIDLGPDGGEGGGEIVVAGTPKEVAKSKQSETARFLRRYL